MYGMPSGKLMVVQNRAADRRIDECAVESDRIGVDHVLIVIGLRSDR